MSQTEREKPPIPEVVKIRHYRKGAYLGLAGAKLDNGKTGILLPLESSEVQDLSQSGVETRIVDLSSERAKRTGILVDIKQAHQVVNRRLRLANKGS